VERQTATSATRASTNGTRALGVWASAGPKAVSPTGGKFVYEDYCKRLLNTHHADFRLLCLPELVFELRASTHTGGEPASRQRDLQVCRAHLAGRQQGYMSLDTRAANLLGDNREPGDGIEGRAPYKSDTKSHM